MNVAADVVQDLSPNDEMFAGNREHYLSVGQSALENILTALAAAKLPETDVRRILDLPCGHGRVMRHLRARFPAALIYGCDLLRDGVDFCARIFNAVPVYSEDNPERIAVADNSFDLIWVGSLFTHFDVAQWAQFLERFRRMLRPGGVLAFSTHGRFVYRRSVQGDSHYGLSEDSLAAVHRGYEKSGFGYAHYSHSTTYGISISNPEWVLHQIAQFSDLRVVHFCERAWDRHQDVVACVREPEWQLR